jgi:hypothetical protein
MADGASEDASKHICQFLGISQFRLRLQHLTSFWGRWLVAADQPAILAVSDTSTVVKNGLFPVNSVESYQCLLHKSVLLSAY